MTLDIVDATMAIIKAAGIADVCRKLSDGHEAVVVRRALSPTPSTYFDQTLDSDIIVTVTVKREDEEQAEDEACLIEGLLRINPPYSLNDSYALTSVDVAPARGINWDEKGFYVWLVQMTAHTTRKD